jgi:hypothetical protein
VPYSFLSLSHSRSLFQISYCISSLSSYSLSYPIPSPSNPVPSLSDPVPSLSDPVPSLSSHSFYLIIFPYSHPILFLKSNKNFLILMLSRFKLKSRFLVKSLLTNVTIFVLCYILYEQYTLYNWSMHYLCTDTAGKGPLPPMSGFQGGSLSSQDLLLTTTIHSFTHSVPGKGTVPRGSQRIMLNGFPMVLISSFISHPRILSIVFILTRL